MSSKFQRSTSFVFVLSALSCYNILKCFESLWYIFDRGEISSFIFLVIICITDSWGYSTQYSQSPTQIYRPSTGNYCIIQLAKWSSVCMLLGITHWKNCAIGHKKQTAKSYTSEIWLHYFNGVIHHLCENISEPYNGDLWIFYAGSELNKKMIWLVVA